MQETMRELLNTWFFHYSQQKAICFVGECLSWDARCAGIYLGFGIAVMYQSCIAIPDIAGARAYQCFLRLALFVPMLADVARLEFRLGAPSNDVRLITGIWFGIGLSLALFGAVSALASWRTRHYAGRTWLAAFVLIPLLLDFGHTVQSRAAYYVSEGLAIIGAISLFSLLLIAFVVVSTTRMGSLVRKTIK